MAQSFVDGGSKFLFLLPLYSAVIFPPSHFLLQWKVWEGGGIDLQSLFSREGGGVAGSHSKRFWWLPRDILGGLLFFVRMAFLGSRGETNQRRNYCCMHLFPPLFPSLTMESRPSDPPPPLPPPSKAEPTTDGSSKGRFLKTNT